MQQRIGRYQIIEEIASGGQGAVYRVWDTLTGQTIALKVLHPHMARDTAYLERFHREARMAASINHPNVIRIYEVGQDGDSHFIAMEFLPLSLHSIIEAQGELPIERAVEICRQTALGLQAAHEHGIIHRDIKPQNILLASDGTVKVTDFGIARAADMSTMTRTGAVMGTPHYMSPEQARGNHVDARCDIYSLGIVLFQMLTGELPFDSDTPWEVIRQHIEERPDSVRDIRREVSRELARVVEQAMEKNPARRFQSMLELTSVLPALSSQPTTVGRQMLPLTPPPPALEVAPLPSAQGPGIATPEVRPATRSKYKPRSRILTGDTHRLFFGLVATAIILATALGLGSYAIFRPPPPTPVPLSRPATPQPAAPAAPAPSAAYAPQAPVQPMQPPPAAPAPTAVSAVFPSVPQVVAPTPRPIPTRVVPTPVPYIPTPTRVPPTQTPISIATQVPAQSSSGIIEKVTTIPDFIINCTSRDQLCTPPYSIPIETAGLLQIKYTVRSTHCAPIRRLYIQVDGVEVETVDSLGWPRASGTFASWPLDTGLIDLGPVSPGKHDLSIQMEGQPGGCNPGYIPAWGGSLEVHTSSSAAAKSASGNYPLGRWSGTCVNSSKATQPDCTSVLDFTSETGGTFPGCCGTGQFTSDPLIPGEKTKISYVYAPHGYIATHDATLSADGRCMSGPWSDNLGNAGTVERCWQGNSGNTIPSLPAGLVSWWPGNGNANDAVGGNHGTLTGGTGFASGKFGQAFSFDGVDDGVLVWDAPSLNVGQGNDFSIDAWIKVNPGVTKPFPWVMNIASKRKSTGSGAALGYGLFLRTEGMLGIQLADAPIGAFSNFISPGPDIRDGKFHHVAVVVDRDMTSGGKLFVDGQAVLTFNPTFEPGDFSNDEPFRIGIHTTPGYDAFFEGLIDEVRVFRRALSASEIKTIFDGSSDGLMGSFSASETATPTATPVPKAQYTLTVNIKPTEAAQLGGGANGAGVYEEGAEARVSAIPEGDCSGTSRYTFAQFEGVDTPLTQNPGFVTMDGDKTITAVYLLKDSPNC